MAPGLKLKLNTGTKDAAAQPSQPPTPSIKLKFGSSSNTPAPTFAVPAPPKAAKPTSKKRAADNSDDKPAAKKRAPSGPTIKLGGISKTQALADGGLLPPTPHTATTKFKITGPKQTKFKPRELGVGYDSEAEDAEEDPAIESNLILRMRPGQDCDYIRTCLENRTIGLPLTQGGAHVHMRFFRQSRRAAVVIRGHPYAAVLVDLPCIVESMKSWDRRGWWKCADICQMLLVFSDILESEEDAEKCPLPAYIDDKTWQWSHGLTPPMYNVRKRRFRKRVNYKTIEAAEAEVNRLLQLDAEAKNSGGTTGIEEIDLNALRGDDVETEEDQEEYEADGGEVVEGGEEYDEDDEEEPEDAQALADRMALELGGEYDDEDLEDSATVAETTELQGTPADTQTVPTPAVQDSPSRADQVEAESESESEEDEVEEAVVNEEDLEKAQMLAQQREEIVHMQGQIAETIANRDKAQNVILKQRYQARIEVLEKDVASKKRAIGDDEDGDDE